MAVLEKDEPLDRRRHQATGSGFRSFLLMPDAFTRLRITLSAIRFRTRVRARDAEPHPSGLKPGREAQQLGATLIHHGSRSCPGTQKRVLWASLCATTQDL